MDAPQATATLWFTERTPAVCRLSSVAVEFLRTEHRTHLRLEPTGRRGLSRITPRGVAGVIAAPDCRLVIRPKIPLANLFFLLDPAAEPLTGEDRTATVEGAEAFHFLVAGLARRLEEVAAAGLHHGYAERADDTPVPRGKLDLGAKLREPPGRTPEFPCRFDDFTPDVACNRAARGTAERVLASPLLTPGSRAALLRALTHYATVTSVATTPETVADAVPFAPVGYRPLLDLCHLLLEGLAPSENSGAAHAPSFLLDLERVFEAYLTRAVVDAFAETAWTVSPQRSRVAARAAGQPPVVMRPDLTIDRAGRALLVLDAKWKRWPDAANVTADLYQVLAYCVGLGVERAVLVYPGRRERVWSYHLGPATVDLWALRVVGSPSACRRSLTRLLRRLRRVARS
jgi:5-methylcytosine-specific restriction enzyme subunit McrC